MAEKQAELEAANEAAQKAQADFEKAEKAKEDAVNKANDVAEKAAKLAEEIDALMAEINEGNTEIQQLAQEIESAIAQEIAKKSQEEADKAAKDAEEAKKAADKAKVAADNCNKIKNGTEEEVPEDEKDEADDSEEVAELKAQIAELQAQLAALTNPEETTEPAANPEEEEEENDEYAAMIESLQKQVEDLKQQLANSGGNITGDGNTGNGTGNINGDGNNSGNTYNTTNTYTDSNNDNSVNDSYNTNTDTNNSVNNSHNTNNNSNNDNSKNQDSHDKTTDIMNLFYEQAMKRRDLILDRLKAFFEWDGNSEYQISAEKYSELQEKIKNGEELTSLEKLQMAVYDLNSSIKEIVTNATNTINELQNVDQSQLQQMSDPDGRLIFKDANNQHVMQNVGEDGSISYSYEDGTAFEGTEEELNAVMGYQVKDENGSHYTDADGNKVFMNVDEEGNEVYTNEDGSPFEGDVEVLNPELKEYKTEEEVLADCEAQIAELGEKFIPEGAENPAAKEVTPEDTAAGLGLSPTDKNGAFTQETPMGTYLYIWDPQNKEFKSFTMAENNEDTEADFTPDGKAIDRSNEEAVKAEAMLALQNEEFEIDPNGSYPFSAIKDGEYYEYDVENGCFKKKEVEQ